MALSINSPSPSLLEVSCWMKTEEQKPLNQVGLKMKMTTKEGTTMLYCCMLGLYVLIFSASSGDCATITTPSMNVQYLIGGTATLICTVENVQAGEIVFWRYVDHNVNITQGTDVVASGSNSRYSLIRPQDSIAIWNLQINQLQAEDAGSYNCSVTGPTMQSVVHHLEVVGAPPKPTIPPLNISDCCVSAGVLQTCMPLCDPASYSINAIVNATQPGGCIDVDLEKVLTCGNGGRNLVGCCMRSGVSGICLDLCGADTLPADDYTECVGSAFSIMRCYEEGLELIPTRPVGVSAQSTPSGIIVYWQKPQQNADLVSQYKVLYRKALETSSDFQSYVLNQNTSLSVVFNTLERNVLYQFKVVAVSVFGASMPSAIIEHANDFDDSTLIETTTNIKACCVSKQVHRACRGFCTSDTLLTGLTPDALRPCYGDLENIYSCVAGQRNHTLCCERVEVPEQCFGMCSGQHYPLTWETATSCMISLPSIVACIMEGSELLPPPPISSRLVPGSITDTTAGIQWARPVDYASYDYSYVVGWKQYNTSDRMFTTATVYGTQYTMTGLSPLTLYEAQVVTQNVNGSSLPDSTFLFLTEETPSDIPQKPYNETECCVNKGISDVCLPLCNQTFRNSSASDSLALVCSAMLINMLECASDGRNHSDCCRRRGVATHCLPLCEIGANHELRDGNELQFIICYANKDEIDLCYQEGRVILPKTPDQFSVRNVTDSQIVLDWKAPSGPSIRSYIVQKASDSDGPWSQLTETTSTHYVASDLRHNTLYFFRVMSKNDVGTSLPSAVFKVYTKDIPIPSTGTPLNWTESFENKTDCCRNSNLSSTCQTQCLEGVPDQTTCLQDFDTIIACGADGHAHGPCCRRFPNFPRTCFPYCGGTPPVRDVRSAFCWSYLNIILTCYNEGSDILPTPPRNLAVSNVSSNSVHLQWQVPAENCIRTCAYVVYYWRDDDLYQQNMIRQQVSTAFASFDNLEPDIEYEFSVVAKNSKGHSLPTSSVRTITLKNTLPPLSIYQTPTGVLDRDTPSVTLTCTALGSPAPTGFEWLFKKTSLSLINSLTVTKVAKSDEGQYTCRAQFPNTKREKDWRLNVRYLPEPALLNETRVRPGANENALLKCGFRGYPTEITWSREATGTNKQIENDDKYQLFSKVYNNQQGLVYSTLMVRSVVYNDLGRYICTGHNTFGSQSIQANLTYIKDQVPVRPVDTTVNITKCCASKNLPSICVEKVCNFGIDINTIVSDLSLLVCLGYVDELLSCAADGRSHSQCCERQGITDYCLPFCDGIVPATDYVTNHLQCLSSISTIFECVQQGHDLLPSKPLVVTAQVVYDELKVSWVKPAKNADKVGVYRVYVQPQGEEAFYKTASKGSVSLSIDTIHKDVVYKVWVVAYNDFGHSANSTILNKTIERLTPGEPENLTGTLVAISTIRLRWDQPTTSVPVEQYAIHFRPTINVAQKELVVYTGATSFRLDNLLTNNVYVIFVTALSTDGEGKPSETLHINTHASQVVPESIISVDNNQKTTELAVGLVLGLALLIAIITAAVFLYRRYRSGEPAATTGSVAFENPQYGNREGKISGLPDEGHSDPAPRNQFNYGHLEEDRDYPQDGYHNSRNDTHDIYDNQQRGPANGHDNPSFYDSAGSTQPATLNVDDTAGNTQCG